MRPDDNLFRNRAMFFKPECESSAKFKQRNQYAHAVLLINIMMGKGIKVNQGLNSHPVNA